jgi:hypothetical protein
VVLHERLWGGQTQQVGVVKPRGAPLLIGQEQARSGEMGHAAAKPVAREHAQQRDMEIMHNRGTRKARTGRALPSAWGASGC